MQQAIDFLRAQRSFTLATHENPDADTLGSALALAEALRALGKDAVVYNPDGVPRMLAFLPNSEMVTRELPGAEGRAFVLIDCNTPLRAGIKDTSAIEKAPSLVIDHHKTESEFGTVRWIETREPATGLMVYNLVKSMGLTLSKNMAMNLYTALAIDTGTFRFGNTTPESLLAAAEMVRAGVEPGVVTEKLYQAWTEGRYKLLSMLLATTDIKGDVVFSHVTDAMLRESGATMEDTENFVNYPLMIESVKISVLIKERDKGRWRVSLRSKGSLDVSGVAAAFGGGGHRNAAGCFAEGDLAGAKSALHKALIKALPV